MFKSVITITATTATTTMPYTTTRTALRHKNGHNYIYEQIRRTHITEIRKHCTQENENMGSGRSMAARFPRGKQPECHVPHCIGTRKKHSNLI